MKRLLLILSLLALSTLALTQVPAIQDRLVARAMRVGMDHQDRQALFADDALRLLVCGSSSPFPSEDRARPCLAVIAGGKFYVVDVGPGAWNRLALLRIPGERIGGVLLTHFHSDHLGDLGELNLQTWIAGRDTPLPVYGPAGIARVVAGFNEAYAMDRGYRVAHHGAALLDPDRGLMHARPLTLDAAGGMTPVFEDGDLKVRVFPVTHAPIEPAVGYRFDYKGRSLVISGDTVIDANLKAAARGTDLLAHEAQNQEMVARLHDTAKALGRPRLEKVFSDIPSYHASPVEAARLANEAGVPTLLLYHLTPPPPNRLAEQVFLRGVDAVRPEGVVLARDGLLLELPLGGGAAQVRQLR
ncbi:MAG TPA: MBL fold metallo-hydrolase [Solimonas sp.]|nr:MBL fold metallo-hydrolase [Solimonas sp.]